MPAKPKEDKLAQLRKNLQRIITLKESKVDLVLRRWVLTHVLSNGSQLMEIVKDLAKSPDPKAVHKFMSMSTVQFIGQYKEKLQTLIANTLYYKFQTSTGIIEFTDNDFKSDKEALEFVENLPAGDLVQLVSEIYKDNFLPLVESLGLRSDGQGLSQIVSVLRAMKTWIS